MVINGAAKSQNAKFSYINQKHVFDEPIKEAIKTLCKYDNFHCFLALGANTFWIVLGVYLSCLSFYFYPLTLLILGSRQRALATLLHDATHHCLAKNQLLNKIFGTFFSGYLIFQSWNAYQKSHVYKHHIRLGDPEQDPDFKFMSPQACIKHILSFSFFINFCLNPCCV